VTTDTAPAQPPAAAPRLDPQARGLIEQLVALVGKEDRGALAQLRRSAGKEPGEAAGVFQYVVPYVPGRTPHRTDDRSDWIETCRYLVAGLFALHPPALLPNRTVAPMPSDSLGAAFNRMAPRGAGNREAMERRFSQLLVADAEELPDRLRQAISLLRAADQAVDWRWLLADLERWRARDRLVQRRWAQDFWRLPERERDEDEPTANKTPGE